MVKTATETTTRATRGARVAAPEKPKEPRQPSAYNLYMKNNLKKYREEHNITNKEAMKAVAAMWRDAPENPNRGQDPKAAKPKKAAPKTKVAKPSDDTATSEAEPSSDP